jgi:hypothetical protein
MDDPTPSLNLYAVLPALRQDTIDRLPITAGITPFADVIAQCDNQMLAVLMRDIEDFEHKKPNSNTTPGERSMSFVFDGLAAEQDFAQAIKLITEVGERRMGKDLFWALISEYE